MPSTPKAGAGFETVAILLGVLCFFSALFRSGFFCVDVYNSAYTEEPPILSDYFKWNLSIVIILFLCLGFAFAAHRAAKKERSKVAVQ